MNSIQARETKNNENNTITVGIKQDSVSLSVTLDAELNTNKKRLVPGNFVDFVGLAPGNYDLNLTGILSTGTKDFKLTFQHASRPNGDDNFEDTITSPNYVNSITIKVS